LINNAVKYDIITFFLNSFFYPKTKLFDPQKKYILKIGISIFVLTDKKYILIDLLIYVVSDNISICKLHKRIG